MKYAAIDRAACRGCRLCRKACPVAAITIREGCAHIEPSCVHCGKCLKACPFHAILEKDTPAHDGAT